MLKLTALLITLGLWFGITGLSTPISKRFTIPLIPSIATDVEITNAMITDVDIVVSGDKRRVDQISRGDLVATLDLRDVAPGERVISLSPETVSVTLPQGVKLVEVQPSRIPVNLETVEEKDVEVKIVTTGELPSGLEIYSTSVVPPRIRVRGPASYIRSLDHVDTDPVDLTGKDRDFTARQIPVSVSHPKAAVFSTIVDVVFRIGEKRIERSFTIPVSGTSLPIAGIERRAARFTLYGPRTLLEQASANDFRVDIPESGSDAPPRLVMPPEFQGVVEIRRLTVR